MGDISIPEQHAPIRSMDEYRRRYFPAAVEAERRAAMTPEEIGAEMATTALRRIEEALR